MRAVRGGARCPGKQLEFVVPPSGGIGESQGFRLKQAGLRTKAAHLLRRAGRCLIVFILFAIGALAFGAGAPPPRPRTVATVQQIYAAFTLNLTRFITWPDKVFPNAEAPFVIGTFPRDFINDELDAIVAGESVNGHPIRAIRLLSLEDVKKCHLIFVSRHHSRQAAVLERCAGKPILTIGDGDAFLQLGGHVRFVHRPPHIRPSISQANLKASGLEARAQLLRIAAAP